MTNSLCGCGNPTRYSHVVKGIEKMSCNKYIVCPTYDELLAHSRRCLLYEVTLQQIVDINAMDYEYRTWAKNVLTR
jgi:hypothetical protein